VGIFFIQPQNYNFDVVPQYGAFSSAVLILIYAFVGFEVAVIPAGETKDPAKNFPFALLTALGIVAFIYILIQIVSIGTLPNLAASERPLADAASSFMGPIGAAFIVGGALVSILGNLNVGIFGASRIMYAMGAAKEVPSALATTHPRFRTPYVSIILNAAIVLLLTIWASFLTAVAIATITRLLVYATTCLSLIVFRRRKDMPPAPFLAPLGVLAALLSLALIAWLLINWANVDFSKEGLPIVIAVVAGLLIYLGTQAARKFRGDKPSESI
jgi:amino acid transporter